LISPTEGANEPRHRHNLRLAHWLALWRLDHFARAFERHEHELVQAVVEARSFSLIPHKIVEREPDAGGGRVSADFGKCCAAGSGLCHARYLQPKADTYNKFVDLVFMSIHSVAMTRDEVMSKPWWTTQDVAIYLGKTVDATRQLMRRAGVKRSKADRTLTCRVWVDKALGR